MFDTTIIVVDLYVIAHSDFKQMCISLCLNVRISDSENES